MAFIGRMGTVRDITPKLDIFMFFFFFKQKTAYEIYQCDWSSDVCSSDLKKIREIFKEHILGGNVIEKYAMVIGSETTY